MGVVCTVGDGIAVISGLDNIKSGEMVSFKPSNIQGMALV